MSVYTATVAHRHSACCHESVHFNPYGGAAAELAAALVNLGEEASPEQVTDAMRRHGNLRDPPGREQTRTLCGWARKLAAVFAAHSLDDQVDLVNVLLIESASVPHVSRHHDKAPHLHYAPDDADTVAAVKAFTAAGLAAVLCSEPHRLGVCARPGCDVVFVDTSRNGRRRFCSTRCSTRVHVAEHRRRRSC